MTGRDLAAALVARGLPKEEEAGKTVLFERALPFLPGAAAHAWWVPGRLEVFGKHTDYAGGRSLVCAVPRGFALVARPRSDDTIRVTDALTAESFVLSSGDSPPARGWRRYVAIVLIRDRANGGNDD